MSFLIKVAALLAASFALSAPLASAANNDLKVNGFLSIGAGVTQDDEMEVAGFNDTVSFNNDTIVGLQFTKSVNDKVTFNAQLTGRGGMPGYDIRAIWAFARIQAIDNLAIRAGRIRLPFYMFSEFVDVSYAYPWIRPPRGFTLPFSDFDGINAAYSTYVGDADVSFETYAGKHQDTDTTSGLTDNIYVEDLRARNVRPK